MRHRQRIPFDVGVVRLHADRHRRVFVRSEAVVDCIRSIIHRCDRTADSRRRRAALTIADRVRVRGRAVVVGARHEGQRVAVGTQRDRTVRHSDGCATSDDGRAVHLRDRQRVAIDIAVVRLHRHRCRCVFIDRAKRISDRNRRVVHRVDGSADGG